jgi:hypothetical protein
MSESNIRDQGRADRQPTLTAVVAVAGNLDAILRSIRMRQTRKLIMTKTHAKSQLQGPQAVHPRNPNTQQWYAEVPVFCVGGLWCVFSVLAGITGMYNQYVLWLH